MWLVMVVSWRGMVRVWTVCVRGCEAMWVMTSCVKVGCGLHQRQRIERGCVSFAKNLKILMLSSLLLRTSQSGTVSRKERSSLSSCSGNYGLRSPPADTRPPSLWISWDSSPSALQKCWPRRACAMSSHTKQSHFYGNRTPWLLHIPMLTSTASSLLWLTLMDITSRVTPVLFAMTRKCLSQWGRERESESDIAIVPYCSIR